MGPIGFGVIYQGSVKDILGPIAVRLDQPEATDCVLFRYSDAYSVFDWGRMPDALSGKGSALAVFAAAFFESLGAASTWKDFSKSQDALLLRKENRFGSDFNEVGETLQREGLRTHYVGLVTDAVVNQISLKGSQAGIAINPLTLSQWKNPAFQSVSGKSSSPSNPRHMLVREVEVKRPRWVKLMGRDIPDYRYSEMTSKPRLIPLEVVFRFSCPEGSSLISRVEQDPTYLSERGFSDWKIEAGKSWNFPLIELFTKLETSDRPVSLTEALAISGISASSLQEMMLRTAWVAGWLRWFFAKKGIELADGKLEWAIQLENGKHQLVLVDAIGPDELRLLSGPVQLSKEFLRQIYRKMPWYEKMLATKKASAAAGEKDWKKGLESPPALPKDTKELAQNLYFSLAKWILEEDQKDLWFEQAPPLRDVIDQIREMMKEVP